MTPHKLALIILILTALGCRDDRPAFQQIVQDQITQHPKVEPQDLYLLTYQSSMGGRYTTQDSAALLLSLVSELDSLRPSSKESLSFVISPDGEIIRLNLRHYKALNGNPRQLLHAMLQSGTKEKTDRLKEYWGFITELAKQEKIPFKPRDLKKYMKEMESRHFPTVEHSYAYRKLYKPAYRVIRKQFVPSLDQPNSSQ